MVFAVILWLEGYDKLLLLTDDVIAPRNDVIDGYSSPRP